MPAKDEPKKSAGPARASRGGGSNGAKEAVGGSACAGSRFGARGSSDGKAFPVVGLGASAGGLAALKEFFSAMPPDSGIAFVLIQHLDPAHRSLTAELLGRNTTMKVVQAEDQMPVEINHVYVIPPNKYLTIRDGVLHLSTPITRHGTRMPIDFFFRSLSESQEEQAIGIILSGTGTDGTLGLKAIKGRGGVAMAQAPETAEYNGMPRSAIATEIVDYVLPIREMPRILIQYVQHSYIKGVDKGEEGPKGALAHLDSILTVLHTRTKFDFHCYKQGTLIRHIRRRMSLN